MRILVIDNYDSFVFNLVQYLGQLGAECEVRRNDEISVDDVGSVTSMSRWNATTEMRTVTRTTWCADVATNFQNPRNIRRGPHSPRDGKQYGLQSTARPQFGGTVRNHKGGKSTMLGLDYDQVLAPTTGTNDAAIDAAPRAREA